MSHLTSVKTEIKDLTALTNALHEMGYSLEGAGVVTYRHESVKADAVMNIEGRTLGFVRGEDGSYSITADWHYAQQVLGPQHQFVGRLSQLYGVHKAILEATLEGYMVERETDANGMIRLTLSRA